MIMEILLDKIIPQSKILINRFNKGVVDLYKGDLINKLWSLFAERKYLETRDLFYDKCRVIMENSREIF